MCEVLDRAENRGRQKGLLEGKAEGRAEGRIHTLIELASDGLLSLSEAAARAKLSEQEFTKAAEEYRRHSGTDYPLPQ